MPLIYCTCWRHQSLMTSLLIGEQILLSSTRGSWERGTWRSQYCVELTSSSQWLSSSVQTSTKDCCYSALTTRTNSSTSSHWRYSTDESSSGIITGRRHWRMRTDTAITNTPAFETDAQTRRKLLLFCVRQSVCLFVRAERCELVLLAAKRCSNREIALHISPSRVKI